MTKSRIVLIVILVAAVVVIGVIAWSLSASAPSSPVSLTTSGSSTGSSPASSSAGTTGTVGVSVSGAYNATSTSWQSYTSKTVNISFSYPPGWSLGPNTPISFDNFEHQYGSGGTLPPGGAEVDITNTKLYGSLDDLVKTEDMGGTGITTSNVTVSGVSCREVSYTVSSGASYKANTVAVYCPTSNSLLYKIYLIYRADDPNTTQLRSTFGQVLNSIRFGQ